ncbi:MAG: hypothetical protein A2168_02285 [Planctomycetes bacterium RBG_13_50_24]|nr:MAG: hypothetical protein A2168_02285 [Planctomycetes bacterium RBG_13_50_24]
MREIRRASRFKKDYKKAKKQHKDIGLLQSVITNLANGKSLPPQFQDHPLGGNWNKYRELHLESDWLLIYKLTPTELQLARLGSHSELF